jgi:hypothetical protein
MRRNDIITELLKDYPKEIIEVFIENYVRALGEYRKGNWKYVGNEIGQYVECAYRMIDYKLTGKYIPLNDKLPNFNEIQLNKWENANSNIIIEYRIIIPRNLYAMYCIRNKRGMIHKNHIDPNYMDATYLCNSAKWVLAEFFRLSSNKSFDETIEIVNSIINREINLIWNSGSIIRILDSKMNCSNQVLCLLYVKNNQTTKELFKSTEYSNLTKFKGILKDLHNKRLIEYNNQICTISPLGEKIVEELLNSK